MSENTNATYCELQRIFLRGGRMVKNKGQAASCAPMLLQRCKKTVR